MELFDTHAHLLDERFDKDRQELIEALPGRGLTGMIEVGCDIANSRDAASLAAAHSFIYAAVGVHPHEAAKAGSDYISELEELTTREKVVAIGEIGLDYHYDFSPRDRQKEVFAAQLKLAKRLGVPVVLHMREATADMLAILREYAPLSGVMHCFSGSAETAEICIGMGLCVSFTGVITFGNARKVVDAARAVPLPRLMAETDCPYLSPEPVRGRRNDPGNVKYVIEKLAEIKGISADRMAAVNIENAKRLYGIE